MSETETTPTETSAPAVSPQTPNQPESTSEPAPASQYKDYTSFYDHNERVAEELRRLLRTGALDDLVGLLRSSGARLEFESFSPALKQAEYLGQLEPGEARHGINVDLHRLILHDGDA